MRKSGLLFFAAVLFSLSAYATPEKIYNAETITLKNGMQVVVIPNHRAPVVAHMVWYKVGAADEPQGDGVSGAAHFLEHLMFKGTKAIPSGEFSKFIRSLGGEDNAFTSWDFTAYFQSVAKDHLWRVMAMEADRMMNATLPEHEIAPERNVIIEERRQRTDNDPQALFHEQLIATLFMTTPYATPIIGWRDEMPKLTRQDVHDYYQNWYAPNNAILVISGDVTMKEVAPLAEKYYGILPSHDVPPHIRPVTPDFPAPVTLRFESDDLRQPVFMRGWRTPSYMTDKKEALAFDVLVEALDGNSATELYQDLVVKQKIASEVSLSYDGSARGEGSIWLTATPSPSVSLESLELALEKKLLQLIEAGIASDAIEKAKTRIIDSQTYARDSVTGPAMVIGQSLAMGLTLDDVETWPQQIAQVTKADVNSVLKKYLSPQNPAHLPITGYMVPTGGK